MKAKIILLSLMVIFLFTNCPKEETVKAEENFQGTYSGQLKNSGTSSHNGKTLSIVKPSVSSQSGTYTIGTGTGAIQGTFTGSVVGLIVNFTLKPSTSGVTYTLGGTYETGDKFIGTMKGTENSVSVSYDVTLTK